MKRSFLFFALLMFSGVCRAEDGYRLWLRYNKIENAAMLHQYRSNISGIAAHEASATLMIAKKELQSALEHLLDAKIADQQEAGDKTVVLGTPQTSPVINRLLRSVNFNLGKEGYAILTKKNDGKKITMIAANTDIGVLYGTFAFLRLIQTFQSIDELSIVSVPKIQHRVLNHWDNLNRSVERGYAGISIWNWHTLPGYIDQRYIDYARANASIGINGTVLTNVNANSLVLTRPYLEKVKALADVFRPYGIQVYLTAKFNAPVEIGGLKTADPLNAEVKNWWAKKCDDIYELIPDFGGFLIKANSEGQPGPQGYGRTHADGANMFADVLAPHGGMVMWRAFVYDARVQKEEEHFSEGATGHSSDIAAEDRFKQAYDEFKPLDGKFRKNVLVQVKNGPIDFQPREPFSPLLGAMPQTNLALEFQLTQEYLGQGTHLVYEAPLFKECLNADTYIRGEGSTVAKVIDGSLQRSTITAIAGVANIGNDINWTAHPFGQANWYAFGRLAWNHDLSSEEIAEEWLKQTFTNDGQFVAKVKDIMMGSREAAVNYMTPLGLHHIMGTGHHYGPAPWVANAGRADWNPVYYHKADQTGLGFDRTATGSNALAQYAPRVQQQWGNRNTCDEKFILWFHHVPWNFRMKSGKTLWGELCDKYYAGAAAVRWMEQQWDGLRKYVDRQRFEQVRMLLKIQEKEAVWWRNACLLYFQTFSKQPIPGQNEPPRESLDDYKRLRFPLAPGINNVN
ncbi:alpha-glucuronidase family glycosyl hydrolase [Niabella beijingensis]|uniref:alpha-glucuronidase family glycosyl hydrolase n=1 Tax=Niabella beijingensis TaxID=2872700 RepID=UPI001CBC57B9|nr:alpha-glucuronidase family glycosyl hydrolase [Niabella beijingensis]MBZ4191973.1 alpha-glucuronidase [Niabella beijingensis]